MVELGSPPSDGVSEVLQLKVAQQLAGSAADWNADSLLTSSKTARRCRSLGEGYAPLKLASADAAAAPVFRDLLPPTETSGQPGQIDPLYLFACHLRWEEAEEPGAGWELIAAAQSTHADTRAHARALLAGSRHLGGMETQLPRRSALKQEEAAEEDTMKAPYGLEVMENCAECPAACPGQFCDFSEPVLACLGRISQKTIVPPGSILFVEGQAPRGMFIVCSGKVHLSTTSREGKILILKSAGAGEALGLSAAVSGMPYETTAEAARPCVLNFIERKQFLELMQEHSEVGLHTAQCLSRDYRSAYRDIHDLVLTRSSRGKLARLLLTESLREGEARGENSRPVPMTHEEMAMRIGASRETVTRLLTTLRRKRLIRLDGPTLVIRDRTKLEALAI